MPLKALDEALRCDPPQSRLQSWIARLGDTVTRLAARAWAAGIDPLAARSSPRAGRGSNRRPQKKLTAARRRGVRLAHVHQALVKTDRWRFSYFSGGRPRSEVRCVGSPLRSRPLENRSRREISRRISARRRVRRRELTIHRQEGNMTSGGGGSMRSSSVHGPRPGGSRRAFLLGAAACLAPIAARAACDARRRARDRSPRSRRAKAGGWAWPCSTRGATRSFSIAPTSAFRCAAPSSSSPRLRC